MKDFNDPYAARAQRHLADGRKKFAPSPSDLARFDDPGADEVRKRLATVQHLLKEGRDAEAILFSTLAAWSDLTRRDGSLAKANFNPDQPRDEHHQRWVKEGEGGESQSIPLVDVQYRGSFP